PGELHVVLDQQHARLARTEHEAARRVVVLELVLVAGDAGRVMGELLAGDRLAEAETVLAFHERLLFADDLVGAAVDLDLAALVVVVGVDDDFDVKRFALAHLGWHVDGGDLDLRLRPAREWYRRYRH